MRRCIAAECSMSVGSLYAESSQKLGCYRTKRSWVTLSVTSRREISRRDVKRSPLCHVATWITTSRCQFLKSLSRRDVILIFLCHVATCIFTSRRQNISYLTRRDVRFHVATSFGHALCHVATWDFTSRRQLVMSSVTSRRGLVCPLSRRDVAPHVATQRWF